MVDFLEPLRRVLGGFSSVGIMNTISWIIGGIILCAIAGGVFWVYWGNKQFRLQIKVFEIVGQTYEHTINDVAKKVKIGSGGFEVLYLKKSKLYRISYGGRAGKNTYYFFIHRDGYWYNGQIGANIFQIEKDGGYMPVVTTNPTMRSQYTALEKQIDTLHGEKVKFWDKYGNWIMSLAFVLIIGILAWLIYKEMSGTMSSIAGVAEQMTKLTKQLTELSANIDSNSGGLVKA